MRRVDEPEGVYGGYSLAYRGASVGSWLHPVDCAASFVAVKHECYGVRALQKAASRIALWTVKDAVLAVQIGFRERPSSPAIPRPVFKHAPIPRSSHRSVEFAPLEMRLVTAVEVRRDWKGLGSDPREENRCHSPGEK